MADAVNTKLRIHANIEISAAALQSIVAYAKRSANRSESGAFHVDPADQVSEIITRFLEEKNFDGYVQQLVDL